MQTFTFRPFDDQSPRSGSKREQKFSLAELEGAKQIARQEGHMEGAEAATRQAKTEAVQREQALTQVSRMLAEQCAELLKSYQEYLDQQIPALTRLAVSIAKKICTHSLKELPLADIEGVMRQAAPLLSDAPEITITVHSSLAAPLKERVHGLLHTDPQKVAVKISGDETLGMQDCRIAWKNGAISRDAGKLWQEIDGLLEAHIGKMFTAEDSPSSSSTPHAPTATK